ncbi:MAG: hypothetical protein A3B37_01215 [Candidatus Sungbacteria bacterium RIFCSPLOWO2_01_FULL_59_16]|uniref:DDH domain-containing protein n=1 Tax=Candidatus Sungbacteria bacterium RIFCSPLOWO2_01_FULL_59_16 TaxID=1802280 RepID=A0A1G2LBY1_9BACT|nr:MAG: hypothetical protein A3B37_01215 [Candidatus Sungbacteria bacterium RIFCSPLOWO2_01_FULL_59_16]
MDEALKSEIKNAAEQVAGASAIAIVLPDVHSPAVVAAAAAIAAGLRRVGKAVSLFGPPTEPGRTPAPWGFSADGEEPLREFILSFDLARSPIKELRYEKSQNRLDVILAPTGGRIRREDVTFRSGALRYDLAIAVGLGRPEAAARSIARVPELIHERQVVGIDSNPQNTRWAETNLVPAADASPPTPTLAELAHALLAALGSPADDAEIATALLAALAAESNWFRTPARPEVFSLAADLVRRGADQALVRRSASPSLSHLKLAARACVRSRLDAATDTLWATLIPDDFEKTETGEADLAPALTAFTGFLPLTGRTLLLWQTEAGGAVRALTAGDGLGELAGLRPLAPVLTKFEARVLDRTFASFAEAEVVLARLLDRTDAIE